MAQNQDISKYFDGETPDRSNQFFDKINVSQKFSDIERNESAKVGESTVASTAINDEPIVCKIFQANSTVNSLKADPGSFFDMIGSSCDNLAENISDQDSCRDSHNDFKKLDDNCSKFARGTEIERSRDAWIIPDFARKILIEMVTSPPGVYTPTRDYLTMPGVVLEEDLSDKIYEATYRYIGENEALQRKVLTAAEVTQDDRGIRDLIQAGCYRAAVNLTRDLLTIYGQGVGKAGHSSKHTVHSIQLWFTRLSLLVKLRCFTLAQLESEPFGDLDKPDMFFQFYPELYGGRTGTLVPFSMRLLIAQIPAFVDQHQIALTRLHGILTVVKKILSNLKSGLLEDGTPSEISVEARQESVKLWTDRETCVLHAIVSTSLSFKDYSLAIEVMQVLIERECDSQQQKFLQAALGRILLQLGDLGSAEKQFALARNGSSVMGSRDLIDSGLLHLAQNQIAEAYHCFSKASELDPKNVTAVNNMSLCLLYLGKLKQAVFLLEEAIEKNPKLGLHESLLLNLCSLYEFQGSFCSKAKLRLLKMVCQNKGDGFNIDCLKLTV